MRRRLFVALVAVLLLLNTLAGVSMIMAFAHRFRGERQLASADFNEALASFRGAAFWQPGMQ